MRIITDYDQGSIQWNIDRNGRITMSKAKDLLTGGNGVTRMSYLQEVASEILAGPPPPGYQSFDMLRGHELEPYAIRAYEEMCGEKVQRVGFVIADDERIGCSPDGLRPDRALEIKCPLPKHHLRYLDRKQVEKDHGQQMMGEAWVCKKAGVDFVSFCPWVKDAPMIIHQFERDEIMIRKLSDSALVGADEVEEMVKAIRDNSDNSDAIKTIAAEAARYWDSFAEVQNSEVNLDE